MMKNKRNCKFMSMNKIGQFFAIYLVLVTLFMCFLVVMMYLVQNKQVSNSLVSPVKLLELQDKQELFELQEQATIKKLAKDNWGNKDILTQSYCDYFSSPDQEKFRSFLFEDLIKDGKAIPVSALDSMQEKKDFCNDNYIFSFPNSNLIVERKELGKSFRLASEKRNSRNFVVDVQYIYKKQYSFNKEEIDKE